MVASYIEPDFFQSEGEAQAFAFACIKQVYPELASKDLSELLQSFRSTGFYTVSVNEFRELLELGPSYERFNYLRQKVIEPAIEELQSKSSIEILFTPIKGGRSV